MTENVHKGNSCNYVHNVCFIQFVRHLMKPHIMKMDYWVTLPGLVQFKHWKLMETFVALHCVNMFTWDISPLKCQIFRLCNHSSYNTEICGSIYSHLSIYNRPSAHPQYHRWFFRDLNNCWSTSKLSCLSKVLQSPVYSQLCYFL